MVSAGSNKKSGDSQQNPHLILSTEVTLRQEYDEEAQYFPPAGHFIIKGSWSIDSRTSKAWLQVERPVTLESIPNN
jgi:hypothetical protein